MPSPGLRAFIVVGEDRVQSAYQLAMNVVGCILQRVGDGGETGDKFAVLSSRNDDELFPATLCQSHGLEQRCLEGFPGDPVHVGKSISLHRCASRTIT